MIHGLDTSLNRPQKKGLITITITIKDNCSILEFMDNGPGINLKTIQKIGIKKQLLNPNESDEKTILETIFTPGFSSSTIVSELTGRGVGLDTIRGFVEQVQGQFTAEFTEPHSQNGIRKIKFVIQLPLGMIVQF